MMKYFFLFSFLILVEAGYACSCISLGQIDDKQYNQYDLIIKGKVVKILEREFQLDKVIYIKVESYYKGIQKAKTIKVETSLQSGTCGIFPKIGEQWLVFANKVGGVFVTGLCTRTKNCNPNAWDYNKKELEEDLKFLKSKAENISFNNTTSIKRLNLFKGYHLF